MFAFADIHERIDSLDMEKWLTKVALYANALCYFLHFQNKLQLKLLPYILCTENHICVQSTTVILCLTGCQASLDGIITTFNVCF